MYRGDSIILVVLSGVVILWLLSLLRRWAVAPPKFRFAVQADDDVPVTEAVELLEYSGYEVLTGKRKIPISITVNDRTELSSSLFVDHFAAEDDKVYLVKIARERKPLTMSGSGIRDQLFIYQLLYEQAEGILYVDPKHRRIDKIQFKATT